MITTKEIESKILEFNSKADEYNTKLSEIMSKFEMDTTYYSEKAKNSEDKLNNVLDSYNKTVNSIIDILDFSFDSLKENIGDYSEYDTTNLSTKIKNDINISKIISNYRDSTKNEDISLPFNTIRPTFLNTINGFDKRDLIQKEYDIRNSNNIIAIKKDSNIKCVNFGISYSQFNLSHFENEIETDEFNVSNLNINFENNENIIHRYYRGTLFFTDLKKKPEVKAYLMIPDNEVLSRNQSIGPEFLFKFYQTSDYIIIEPVKIKPYRFDWKDKNQDIEVFDMFDKEYYPNSFVQFYCDSFFYDITGGEILLLDSFNESFTEIENSELEIKPLKDGFYKYIGFNPNENEKVVNSENKKYSFFSHEITESINDPSIFSNIKQEDFYDFFDYIYNDYSDVKINDLLIKDGDIYLATNVGIFKKDILLNQYIDLTREWNIENKNFLFIKNDEDNNLITYNKTYGIITGNKNYFDIQPTIIINTFESILQDTDIYEMSYINSIKSAVFYTGKGIYLLTKNYSEYSLLKNIEEISKEKDFDRLRIVKDLVVFMADNYIYTYNYKTFVENEYDLTDFINENIERFENFLDFFIDMKKPCVSYKFTEDGIGVIVDLNSASIKILEDSFDSSISIINHPNINDLIITKVNITDNLLEVAFDITLNDFISDNVENKFTTEYKTSSLSKHYILSKNRYIDINPNNGDYIQYINGYGYKCISNRYNKTKDISDIRSEIVNILENEKIERDKITGTRNSIPYKISINAKAQDELENENIIDSVYDEIGLFNGLQEDLEVNDDKYNFYFTSIGLFAVNKSDNTIVYWSSSKMNTVHTIPKNDIRTIRMNKCIFKMGFMKPCDYDWNEEDTFTVFYGNDNKLYGLGYNINKNIDLNRDADIFINYPIQIFISVKYNKCIIFNNKIFLIDDINKKISTANTLESIFRKDMAGILISDYSSYIAIDSNFIYETNFLKLSDMRETNPISNTINAYIDTNDNGVILGLKTINSSNLNCIYYLKNLNGSFNIKCKVKTKNIYIISYLYIYGSSSINYTGSITINANDNIEYISEIEFKNVNITTNDRFLYINCNGDNNGYIELYDIEYIKVKNIPIYSYDFYKYKNISLIKNNDNYFIDLNDEDPSNVIKINNGYYKLKINNEKIEIINIDTGDISHLNFTEKINDNTIKHIPKEIISSNINTLLVKDIENNLWIFGKIDGFLPGISYTNKFIKVKNTYLTGTTIKDVITNKYRTFLLTENDLYVSGDVNLYYKNEQYSSALGKEDNKTVNYFERISDLQFKTSDIKDIKITNMCSFILLNDGSLYASGNNTNNELGNSDKSLIYGKFTKIKDNVNKIFTGIDNIFISIIDNDDIESIYVSGNNTNNKLGINSLDLFTNSFVKINEISNLDNNILVKNIYCFENVTFVLFNDGSIYRCGLNENYQLGFDDNKIKMKFEKYNFSTDIKISNIITNENNSIVCLIDENGILYISGINITKIKSNSNIGNYLLNFYKKEFTNNNNINLKVYDITITNNEIVCFLKDEENDLYYIEKL